MIDGVTIPEPTTLFDDHKNRINALSGQAMQISKDFYWSNDMLLPGKPTDPFFAARITNGEFARMTPDQSRAFSDAYGPKTRRS